MRCARRYTPRRSRPTDATSTWPAPAPSFAGAEDRPIGTPRPGVSRLDSPSSLIKADAITLQPVEQLVIGGRMHHAQIFQDRYMLVDTFARDIDGLDVFLMDPETDEVIGGVRDEGTRAGFRIPRSPITSSSTS